MKLSMDWKHYASGYSLWFEDASQEAGFYVIAVLSLALGIGATTAIFSLIDAVMIKSLPVHRPEQLVLFGNGKDAGLTNVFPDESWDLYSYPFYRQAQQRSDVFSGVAGLLSIPWTVHGFVNSSGDIEKMQVQLVTGSYFPVLGVNASLGRVLTESDDQTPGGHPVLRSVSGSDLVHLRHLRRLKLSVW